MVISKLSTCAISLFVYLSLCKVLPVDHIIDDGFISSTPVYLKIIYSYLAILALRPKYYFVWTFGELASQVFAVAISGAMAPPSAGFLSTSAPLHQYSHAGVLSPAADAINNAAGFGFNGYDVDGVPQWDLISNLRIMDIEVCRFGTVSIAKPVQLFIVCVLF